MHRAKLRSAVSIRCTRACGQTPTCMHCWACSERPACRQQVLTALRAAWYWGR
jgi:hypothetical protein